MENPVTIWFAVAAMMVAMVVLRTVRSMRHKSQARGRHRLLLRKIISLGSERESLWVPGDSLLSRRHLRDYDED